MTPDPDPLRRAAADAPAAPALSDGSREWSHAELDRAADRLARRLVAAGTAAGDRVALLLPPGAEAVVAIHGVPRAGAVLAPLNLKWSAPERERALAALAPRVILRAGDVPEAGEGAAASDLPPEAPEPPSPHPVAPHDTLAILWTSGTGGRPRGVELTRENLEASARAARAHLELRATDRWYAALNPAHVGGLALVVRAAVVGCAVHVHDGFSAAELNRRIDAGRSRTPRSSPSCWTGCSRRGANGRPPPRCAASSWGARRRRSAPFGARSRWVSRSPSRTGSRRPRPRSPRHRPSSCAAPSPVPASCLAPPRSPASSSASRKKGKSSCGRRPSRAATSAPPQPRTRRRIRVRRTTRGDVPRPPVVDGWLHTGDLGRLDEHAHLRVTGRLSDRIISGGVNVDPSEVEAVVRRHPAVLDASVLGLPDPEWGERVAVAVVLASGASLTRDEILDFTRPHLSPPKRPRALAVVRALPRNANGKVDRERLRGLDWR
jgi:acyl-CoA synthetase (AMP-forming)/AMP-acid ligase II